MKTFTLRLSDLEAEALELIAFCHGQSKNKVLSSLIGSEYNQLLFWGNTHIDDDSELLYLDLPENLPAVARHEWEHEVFADDADADPKPRRLLLRIYNYAIENTEDKEKVDKLIEERDEYLREIRQ